MYHSRIVLFVGGSVWYMIRNLRCTVTIDSVLANSKTQNAFLFTVNAIFRQSRLPPSCGTWKYAKVPSTKKTWRDSVTIDMLLSAVSILVVAQSSSEIPEGLMNNLVCHICWVHKQCYIDPLQMILFLSWWAFSDNVKSGKKCFTVE